MADWDEIKRLAADFQQAQLTSTVQRLSERNCIEIVQKLVAFKLIDVIYTLDGKEYLTHEELDKEILEELQAREGRVNLIDLQSALNVDLNHIEAKVNELLTSQNDLTLVLGQLIDSSYFNKLAKNINDRLQEEGQLTIIDLTKAYDLPPDVLLQTIEVHLGSVIKGHFDSHNKDVLFTDDYVYRQKAIIRGVFSAITRPTTLGTILNLYNLHKSIFYRVLDELISSSQLLGMVSGGHQEMAQYIPDIYTRSQNEWIDCLFKQNGYLEYDSLSRLGISDPKAYIKKRFKSDSLSYLSSCCVGQLLQERIDAEIDEALSSTGWFDIIPSLPSVCTEADASQMLTSILQHKPQVIVICDTIVVNESLISACKRPFSSIIQTQAETVARTNPGILLPDNDRKGFGSHDNPEDPSKEDKKEQRRKKASAGKSGGGTQGREVKTKSTKKKFHRQKNDSNDESSSSSKQTELEFITITEIKDTLRQLESLQDCPEELLTGIAERLHRPLNREFIETAKSIFLQSAGGSTRKKTQAELSDKINSLWVDIKLFEKALKYFNDDTRVLLTRHLLKTIGTDVTNMVFSSVATDHMMSLQDDYTGYTAESRNKILAKIQDQKVRSILSKLNGSLNSKTMEDFFTQLDQACGQDVLDIILRKADKKKERQIVFNHRQALMEQLRQEIDPAVSLHLAAVILFQLFTQNMLHAPGRCVPQIISFLKQHLTPDSYAFLVQYQDLVVKQLRQQNEKNQQGSDGADIQRQLEELLPQVKDIALSTTKTSASHTTEDY